MPITYRPVLEFSGYRVGIDGSVWSCWKRKGLGYGRGIVRILTDEWSQLSTFPNKQGYLFVTLLGKYRRAVHRLVLEAFRGLCPKGMECRHLDGNKANNRLFNLCWGTRLKNWEDRKRHGTGIEGEKNPSAKLTEEDVVEIRRLRSEGHGLKAIAETFGIQRKYVCGICKRYYWKHVL